MSDMPAQWVAEGRKYAAAVSTDAFERLKAIAKEGVIPFCEEALRFESTTFILWPD